MSEFLIAAWRDLVSNPNTARPMDSEAEAWDWLEKQWADPDFGYFNQYSDNGRLSLMSINTGERLRSAKGLCTSIRNMWEAGLIDYDVRESMAERVQKYLRESATSYLWPLGKEGHLSRAMFCRMQWQSLALIRTREDAEQQIRADLLKSPAFQGS